MRGSALSVLPGGRVGTARCWGLICKIQSPTISERHFWSLKSSHTWPGSQNCGHFWKTGFSFGKHSRADHPLGHGMHQVGYQSWHESSPDMPGNTLHMPVTPKQTTDVTFLLVPRCEWSSSLSTAFSENGLQVAALHTTAARILLQKLITWGHPGHVSHSVLLDLMKWTCIIL